MLLHYSRSLKKQIANTSDISPQINIKTTLCKRSPSASLEVSGLSGLWLPAVQSREHFYSSQHCTLIQNMSPYTPSHPLTRTLTHTVYGPEISDIQVPPLLPLWLTAEHFATTADWRNQQLVNVTGGGTSQCCIKTVYESKLNHLENRTTPTKSFSSCTLCHTVIVEQHRAVVWLTERLFSRCLTLKSDISYRYWERWGSHCVQKTCF